MIKPDQNPRPESKVYTFIGTGKSTPSLVLGTVYGTGEQQSIDVDRVVAGPAVDTELNFSFDEGVWWYKEDCPPKIQSL